MSASPPKTGPLTFAELQALWENHADPGYVQPIEQAGNGFGLEAWGQLFQQFARVSQAIDVSTQAQFILPSSQQSNAPAPGGQKATCLLTLTRSLRVNLPLTLKAGQVFYAEEVNIASPGGGVPTLTGIRFTSQADVTFLPGVASLTNVPALAEFIGYGFNNPLIGSVQVTSQPGNSNTNGGASVVIAASRAKLVLAPFPDVLTPAHIGQYIFFTGGLNAGTVWRVAGYTGPSPTGTDGGQVLLAPTLVLRGTAAALFTVGEVVSQATSLATGIVVASSTGTGTAFLVIEVAGGSAAFDATDVVTGLRSTATFTPNDITLQPLPNAETGTAAWRVLDWVLDWQLTVSNTTQPTGGTSAVLDALGDERDVRRAPGEDDGKYRIRVAQLPDTVSPNALRRTANRVLAPFGLSGCLREAGLATLPGVYHDVDSCDNDGLDFLGTWVLPFTTRFFQGELVEQLHSDGSIATATVVGPAVLFRDLSPNEDFKTWQPSTLYGVGQRIVSTNTSITLIFRAAVSGVSGLLEPNWPVTPGVNVPDGGILWAFDRFYEQGEFVINPPPFQLFQVARCRGTFTSTDPIVGQRSGSTFVPTTLKVTPNIVNRFRYLFDYLEMRAFFMMGVPPTSLGEFGIAFDAGPYGFFDAAPYLSFFDGFPVTTAIVQRSIWQHLNLVRAGGVSQDLYVEPIGCV